MDNQETPVTENSRNGIERVRIGLAISFIGFALLLVGAKPEIFGMDRSPTIGFAQVMFFLVGLAFLCLGGYIGIASLWAKQEKSISADIGIRLVSTGYVIALFSGMADVFGMSVQQTGKKPFFGPWQEAGMEVGLIIIAIGLLMTIPYSYLRKNK
ncbi:MAG: hypothetical protein WCP19_01275 [Chloroflexota bacterium]